LRQGVLANAGQQGKRLELVMGCWFKK